MDEMIYYKDPSGEVWAYTKQDVEDGWVKMGLVLMTEPEVTAHLTKQHEPDHEAR